MFRLPSVVTTTAVAASAVAAVVFSSPASAATVPAVGQTGTISVTPAAGLTDGQSVTVSVSGFNPLVPLTFAECSSAVKTSGTPVSDCDLSTAQTTPADQNGAASVSIAAAGSSYSDTDGNTCSDATPCLIAVTDNPVSLTLADYNFRTISFDKIHTTTAAKAGRKSARRGHKVRITVVTHGRRTNGALSGTVVVRRNGKQVAAVAETAKGTVSVKVALVKGKNHIRARFSGNAHYRASAGRVTVTGR